MNDLEHIEHWHLRGVIVVLTVFIALSALLGCIAFVLAGVFAEQFRPFIAAGFFTVIHCLTMIIYLRRAWRRLEALEKFIP